MGLFGKIKDILFEEEEVIEEEAPKKEIKREEKVKVNNDEIKEIKLDEPIKPKMERTYEEPKVKEKEDFLGERDLFAENASPFLDFDEAEFSSVITKPTPTRNTNVLEYERKKKSETKIRSDYPRYEKTEVKETVEKKKFKPSPIISPVYGILNEDYKIEDIKDRNDQEDVLDIETVRKKAFETPKVEDNVKTDYYEEESVTVKYQEPVEEKIQKGKTIDDLLEDTSDEIIDTREKQNQRSRIEYDELDDEFDLDNMAEEIPEKEEVKPKREVNPEEDDDTVETDLFDLIDSMYDSREDGE